MEQGGGDEARDDEVRGAELLRDVQGPESVLLGVVGGLEGKHDEVQGQAREDEGEALDEVVEPIARLVVRQVALVAQDGAQP